MRIRTNIKQREQSGPEECCTAETNTTQQVTALTQPLCSALLCPVYALWSHSNSH